MGNSLSPRHSSSKRRAGAFACLPATPSTRARRRLASAIDARDTSTTSVSTANSAASDEPATKTRCQKVASAASSSSRCVVASTERGADHARAADTHAHLPGAPHAMVAGSMPPAPSAATNASTSATAPLPTNGTAPRDGDATSEQRIRQAERVLKEIADEYAAKRAAGLVPTKPVPARTLLWEELAQQQLPRTGRRGQCIFGRDSGAVCGCTTYRKMDLPTNTGGICECCGHGAPWHRLTGGSMWSGTASNSLRFHTRSHVTNASLLSSSRGAGRRSRAGSSARPLSELLSSSARSRVAVNAHGEMTAEYYDDYSYDDEYDDDDYDSEYDDDDDDDDDEDIANEVARPYGDGPFDSAPPLMRPPGLDDYTNYDAMSSPAHRRVRAESGSSTTSSNYVDRSSIVSNGSNLGLPPRLSSTSRHLDRLLGAIAKYRAMGLGEDEIEARIREDFPPTERMSSAPQ